MLVYRISNCKYSKDLSGKGAALYGGRWNNKDTYILYTAGSRALALLETVVHIGKVPANDFCLTTITIPDDHIYELAIHKLPSDWFMNPPPDNLKKIGHDFVKAHKYLGLKVPSAIVTEEYNCLINPAHPDFQKVKIVEEKTITIDERLLHSK